MSEVTVPQRIKVLGRTFSIRPAVNDGVFGLCWQAEGRIEYDPRLRPVERADTILHEVLHAVLFCQGREPCKHEERYVRAIATGLTAVLADNPKFAEWLCQRSNFATINNT